MSLRTTEEEPLHGTAGLMDGGMDWVFRDHFDCVYDFTAGQEDQCTPVCSALFPFNMEEGPTSPQPPQSHAEPRH